MKMLLVRLILPLIWTPAEIDQVMFSTFLSALSFVGFAILVVAYLLYLFFLYKVVPLTNWEEVFTLPRGWKMAWLGGAIFYLVVGVILTFFNFFGKVSLLSILGLMALCLLSSLEFLPEFWLLSSFAPPAPSRVKFIPYLRTKFWG